MAELEKSWYVKYRPRTMEEYSGPVIKDIVSKRFRNKNSFPHTIYIRGCRGTGKTTFARIISKYYLCENPNEDGTPCECCEMCESINSILIDGESGSIECPGVTEVDATKANGKEAIQEIIDDAMQAPIYTKYKVIIFDECHRISGAAQNALLKTIEDIPEHLVCIFCTTDDEKVLDTIKSRMQLILEARRQSLTDMVNRLLQICKLENLRFDKNIIEIIAKKGNRVPRECINLLEAIAKTYGNNVTIDTVREHLGGLSNDLYLEYFKASNGRSLYGKTSIEELTNILLFNKKIKEQDISIKDFVNGLMQFVLDSMYIKHGISLDEYPPDYTKSVKELFNMYSSSDFDMLLQIIEHLSNNLTDDSLAKNELMLTTTAMRISKASLLANGLAKESDKAVIENKTSLYEHSKLLKTDNDEIAEQMKIDVTPAEIKDSFDNVRVVKGTAGLFDSIQNVDIEVPIYEDSETEQENISLGEAIDDFFDN